MLRISLRLNEFCFRLRDVLGDQSKYERRVHGHFRHTWYVGGKGNVHNHANISLLLQKVLVCDMDIDPEQPFQLQHNSRVSYILISSFREAFHFPQSIYHPVPWP